MQVTHVGADSTINQQDIEHNIHKGTSVLQELAKEALSSKEHGDLKLGKALCAQITKGLEPWMIDFRKSMPPLPVDHYSNARPEEAVTTKMNLQIGDIDFENRTFKGRVEYNYQNKKCGEVDTICLDIKNLKIDAITVNGLTLSSEQWQIKKIAEYKPDALEIAIPKELSKGIISISYQTDPNAGGLYWRPANLTDGKKFPMLFTQAQMLDGASFIPGQHSPQVRLTYQISIDTGSPDLIAITSATDNPSGKSLDGKYSMNMPISIPLYLLGIAIGNFDYHPYDDRCGIYAEGCKLQKAAEKYSQLPEFISKAEEIFGDYMWKVYKPILLTLAYPFGAMEHACASFLGGDCINRLYVLAHELAHSWTGNWVTNATWEQFFFNEGLTSYAEYRICSACISEDYALMNLCNNVTDAYVETKKIIELSAKEGKESEIENAKLCGNFTGSIQISSIPYGKGELFFMMLDRAMGRENFDRFLKDYIQVFALQSMSRDRFEAFLKLWLENNKIVQDGAAFMQEHKFEEWMTGVNMPDNAPEVKSILLDQINAAAEKVLNGEELGTDLDNFDGVMRKTFLTLLSKGGSMTHEKLAKLDERYNFSDLEEDYSILGAWACLCADLGYLTERTEAMLKRFIINRNSQYYTGNIAQSLKSLEAGKALLHQILEEGKDRLDPSVREVILKQL